MFMESIKIIFKAKNKYSIFKYLILQLYFRIKNFQNFQNSQNFRAETITSEYPKIINIFIFFYIKKNKSKY